MFRSMEDSARSRYGEEGAKRAVYGFEKNRHKHNVVCCEYMTADGIHYLKSGYEILGKQVAEYMLNL